MTTPYQKVTVMKRIWNTLTTLSFVWGAYIVLAGLWDLGREVAENRKFKTNH